MNWAGFCHGTDSGFVNDIMESIVSPSFPPPYLLCPYKMGIKFSITCLLQTMFKALLKNTVMRNANTTDLR